MRRASTVLAAVGAAALILTSCGGGSAGPSAAKGASVGLLTAGSGSTAPSAPAGSTLLATTRGAVQGYVTPGGAKGPLVPATWHGAVSTLPVVTAQPGWVDVRLAQRPNESTTWVPLADVALSSSAYEIVIHLSTTRLDLYKSGHLVFSAPAGVGMPAYPTPTGDFFVAFFAQPPSSGYGPFVLVSSAHSNTISDWESSGDALMAIHGPLGADAQIGTTGAYVSHGCVRLHIADLEHLRVVPAGSPIVVDAT
jgi:lipoprotein-anchoring transpeptidase ErfK/SrfK